MSSAGLLLRPKDRVLGPAAAVQRGIGSLLGGLFSETDGPADSGSRPARDRVGRSFTTCSGFCPGERYLQYTAMPPAI